MGEYLYQVMFVNGKAVIISADTCIACDKRYVFYTDGTVTAEFNSEVIAGYMIMGETRDETK